MKMHMKARRFVIPVSAVIVAVVLAVIGGWLALDYVAHAQTSLPAPANVQVVNGDQPGQVVVSWDPVDGASGYAIPLGEQRPGLGSPSRRPGLAEARPVP